MPDKPNDVRYFLGIPYRWQARKAFQGLWDPTDDRLFPPKHFGWGWTVNFHAVGRKLGWVKTRK